MKIKGNLVLIEERRIALGEIIIENGIIKDIIELGNEDINQPYLMPGFIDSHVHIESSMLIPSEFARLAVVHGTVATISDPHEIANVCGMDGIQYMIDDAARSPFYFHFGAPSCVPATTFETAGAAIGVADVKKLLAMPEIFYLSEVMNFPGVLQKDADIMAKIEASHAANKPVDGHAPGVSGNDAIQYINAGISTDHECFTYEEALFKLQHGMKVLIREGSAAKNFEALIPLIDQYPDKIMFCSDDKHPDSLLEGHINDLCRRAVAKGYDLFNILQAACINPHRHYKMISGSMRKNDPADLIVLNDLKEFKIRQTFIKGNLVAENGKSILSSVESTIINNFNCDRKKPADFFHPGENEKTIAIEALDGQLITLKKEGITIQKHGNLVSNVNSDTLKIAVVNRYSKAPVATAFIKNIGLKKGAIATTVAHDSHNIVACGVTDKAICRAVNLLIEAKGGASALNEEKEIVLPLPVAGLMSNRDGYEVANDYIAIDKFVKEELGSRLASPFMTLSFMALLVIPHIKLSDKGLFDGDSFTFI